MSRTVSPSCEQPYGLARVLRTWKITRSGFYVRRQRRRPPQWGVPKRRGPVGPCDDVTLLEHIRRDLKESPWDGEGHRKVWARLRRKGIRTSKVRVCRLMRGHSLLVPMRVGRAHGPKAHDRTIITRRPDEMWGTDMTTTVTRAEGTATGFVAIDHATAECVGIHAAKSGLSLRHDHGSAYLSDVFQDELRFLGIESSPAFVREPEGNGCAERFIRILKETLLWVRAFTTIEELRLALLAFKELSNRTWLTERHGSKTPAQVRQQLLEEAA